METTASIQCISCAELEALRAKGRSLDLIDVRPPPMFYETHVPFARFESFEALNPKAVMASRGDRAGDPLYVICQIGKRSMGVCRQFIDAGYDNVVNVEGGTQAWLQAGLPVVRGERKVSIERQVRTVAGALMLVSIGLGLAVHTGFLAIGAFLGAGLLYSGVSGSCAMGMILAKAPWNRIDPSTIKGT